MDYSLEGGTTLTAFAAYSTIGPDLSDWFDFIGIDPDQIFGQGSLGLSDRRRGARGPRPPK